MRNLITLNDLSQDDVANLLGHARRFKAHPASIDAVLHGRVVGLYFERPSTRTRTSFDVAVRRLGASVIAFSHDELQLRTGETLGDTAKVLSGYLDALVVRTWNTADVAAAACLPRMCAINALTEEEHPTQAIADLLTILEEYGSFKGLHLLFVGAAGNILTSLLDAVSVQSGIRFTILTPEAMAPDPASLGRRAADAARYGADVRHVTSLDQVARDVDVVYTTRWRSMGKERSEPGWRDQLMPLQVNRALIERVLRPGTGIVMHDLPAERGAEVTSEVLDASCSRAWRQADNKLYAAMAALAWCFMRDRER
jgi:ornithine carbamoyltransferase